MTSAVAVREAGHVPVGLTTGRKLQVWVRGGEGCVEFEPFRWSPGVARTRRGLAVDVAGYLAEDLAAGCNRDRLSRRLAGRYSGRNGHGVLLAVQGHQVEGGTEPSPSSRLAPPLLYHRAVGPVGRGRRRKLLLARSG